MKLTKVRITEFHSIQDSTEFDIADVTCLVGKNEAGKTALLKALYRLNPVIDSAGTFNVTDDYPRRAVSDYEDDVEAGRRTPAQVVQATYTFEAEDIKAVEEIFGPKCLTDEAPSITLYKDYSNKITSSGPNVDSQAAIAYIANIAGLSQPLTPEVDRP